MIPFLITIIIYMLVYIIVLKDKIKELMTDLENSDDILSIVLSNEEDEKGMGYVWRNKYGGILWTDFQPKNTSCLKMTKKNYNKLIKGE